MIEQGALAVIIASLITAIAAYSAAKLRVRKKQPQDVIYDGYDRLLKNYQQGLKDRDQQINDLKAAFNKVQSDLNQALDIISQMKEDNRQKGEMIDRLESQLQGLKAGTAENGA